MTLKAPEKMEGTTLTIDTLEQKVNKIFIARKVEFCKAMKPFGNRWNLVKLCILDTCNIQVNIVVMISLTSPSHICHKC